MLEIREKSVKVGRHQLKMQDPGVRWVLQTEERNRTPDGVSVIGYAEAILSDVVVSPKGLTIDDFDHESEIVELIKQFKQFRLPAPGVERSGKRGKGEAQDAA